MARITWFVATVLLLSPGVIRAQPVDEAARVRVLLVLDTDDEEGATWGLDGTNVRTVFEASFKRQQLGGRYTLEVLTGRDVNPEHILAYYKGLQVAANETLLFYYSGHGGYHRNKGHFLALTHGPLYRRDLLAAMQAQRPRLVVVLTDCCSNYAGGAWLAEPAGDVKAGVPGGDKRPRALRQEPVGEVRFAKADPKRLVKAERPNTAALSRGGKASRQEPGGAVVHPLQTPPSAAHGKAPFLEPLVWRVSAGAVLATGVGPVPLDDIVSQSDGVVLRQLLLRPRGVVDINGCAKGELSHGNLAWGGSLFTNAFLGLQRQHVADLDRNGNQVVEWDEFFTPWRKGTTAAGRRVTRGQVNQVPEAAHLAE
jgi:hypothetical protein